MKDYKIQKIEKTNYPLLLRQISRLPETMDMIGSLPTDDNKFLCVIGSRDFSFYGRDACRKLLSGLQGYPIVIVSGLAIGIDSIAHETALENGLKTISFPGSGLGDSVLYPLSKRLLAKKIVDSGGAVLSPFDIDQMGSNWTFPTRNRLMAGTSHATLIIEARHRSGTLITADYAAEFGRDIMVVPGSIFSDLSYGPHMLMRRGAIPVASSDDILEALGFRIARKDGPSPALPNFREMSLSSEEREIVNNLRSQNLSSSDLIEKVSLSPSRFNTAISELELQGIIKSENDIYSLA